MTGNRAIGLAALFALLLIVVMPVYAAEKTIELHIPGCND